MAVATAPSLTHPARSRSARDEVGVMDRARPASGALTAPEALLTIVPSLDRAPQYRCECGHRLWVSGLGRHRVYLEPVKTPLNEPVMERACPACGRGLQGKNPPQQSRPSGRRQAGEKGSTMGRTCCPNCRLRFSPAAAVYLDACPQCGRTPQAMCNLEGIVGYRLITLEAFPHAPESAVAAVSLPIPDPGGRS